MVQKILGLLGKVFVIHYVTHPFWGSLFRFHCICTVDKCRKIKGFQGFGTHGTDKTGSFLYTHFLYIFFFIRRKYIYICSICSVL